MSWDKRIWMIEKLKKRHYLNQIAYGNNDDEYLFCDYERIGLREICES